MSTDLPLAQLDSSRINRRILASKRYLVDFRGVEAASLKQTTRLTSAEGKRLLARCFYIYQKNLYNIGSFGRLKLAPEEIGKLENHLRALLEKSDRELSERTTWAENLLKKGKIEELASYDEEPLAMEVGVISSLGARYLKLIHKMDRLMPLLQTLEIEELITREVFERQRARCKRIILHVSAVCRTLAIGVSKRMQAVDAAAARTDGQPGRASRATFSQDNGPASAEGISAPALATAAVLSDVSAPESAPTAPWSGELSTVSAEQLSEDRRQMA